jgi:hypothetical protein
MSVSIRGTANKRKKVGRPKTTGSGMQIGTRWHEPMLSEIDAWRAAQEDQPERGEAIRRLVAQALEANRAAAPKRRKEK